LNWYAYCANDPINKIDPSGLAVWLVHGTWSDSSTWKSDFREYVKSLFNEEVFLFKWSGEKSDKARKNAAAVLYNQITRYHINNRNEPIRLIGHSHGGNISIIATNYLSTMTLYKQEGIKVQTLITIGTPAMSYKLNSGVSVGSHLNVYNNHDKVQIIGGNNIIAVRKFDSAININAKDAGSLFRLSHSTMHSNVSIWKKYIEPNLGWRSSGGSSVGRY
jgi:poly(3-hydroxyalkanoate) synthetase